MRRVMVLLGSTVLSLSMAAPYGHAAEGGGKSPADV